MRQFGSIASIRPRSARVLCRDPGDLSKEVEAGKTPEQVVGNIAAKTPETGSVVSIDHWHLRLADLDGYQIEIERRPVHRCPGP